MKKLLILTVLSGNLLFACSVAPVTTVSPSTAPVATTPSTAPATTTPSTAPVATTSFAKVKAVIDQKCVMCHSSSNASHGVILDTVAQIKANASDINENVVLEQSMPPNSSSITAEERALIGTWFNAGAPTS